MMFAVVVLVVAGVGPELQLEACPDAWLDVRQVRAQLSLLRELPDGVVRVRCAGGARVELTHGATRRTLTLTGATAAQRERTLSLFIATWLEIQIPSPPEGGEGQGEGPSESTRRGDAGPGRLEARAVEARSADAKVVDAATTAGARGADARSVNTGTADTSSDAGSASARAADARAADAIGDGGSASARAADAAFADGRPDAGTTEASLVDARPTDTPDAGPLEALVPVELGIVPRVGFNRLFPAPTRNYFALGLLGVSSQRLDGLSLGLVTLVDEQLRGAQFGAVSIAGKVDGLQFGGLVTSSSGAVNGAQLSAGLNLTRAALAGVQLGAVNVSGDMTGAQLGLVTVADRVRGVQLGGLITSSASDVTGAQLGLGLNRTGGALTGIQLGSLNVAGDVTGAQLGLINVADDVTGFQLGVLNVARSVRGTQVGLVNISTDGPAPVGVFNVTEDAPLRLSLSLGDTHLFGVALKTGGTRLYGMLSLGWVPRSAVRAGGGLGLHLGHLTNLGWFAQLELTAHGVINIDSPVRGVISTLALGFNVGYRITPRLAVILGPQFSVLFGTPAFPGSGVSLFGIPLGASGLAVAPGGQLGIEL